MNTEEKMALFRAMEAHNNALEKIARVLAQIAPAIGQSVTTDFERNEVLLAKERKLKGIVAYWQNMVKWNPGDELCCASLAQAQTEVREWRRQHR